MVLSSTFVFFCIYIFSAFTSIYFEVLKDVIRGSLKICHSSGWLVFNQIEMK